MGRPVRRSGSDGRAPGTELKSVFPCTEPTWTSTTVVQRCAIAWQHKTQGQIDQAVADYLRVTPIAPSRHEAWHEVGAMLHDAGQRSLPMFAVRGGA